MEQLLKYIANPITWAVIIGLMTVYATIIAPRLGRRGKVGWNVSRIVRVRQATKHEKIEVSYSIDGEAVDDDIFVVECEIKNIGSSDIAKERFQKPIVLSLPDQSKFLSVDVDADTDTEVVFDSNSNEIGLYWQLLKRREVIKISAVCSSEDATALVDKDVKFNCRLIDVDSKAIRSRRIAEFVTVLLILLATGYAALYFDSAGTTFAKSVDPARPGAMTFTDDFQEARICKERTFRLLPRKCSEKFAFDGDLSKIELGKYNIGQSPYLIFGLPVLAVFYIFTLIGIPRFRKLIQRDQN